MKVSLKALLLGGLIFVGNSLFGQDLSEVPNPGLMTLPTKPKVAESSTEEMVSPDTIQFPNNPVSDFLMIYEKLKRVTLIKDASLLAGGANLSLTLDQPVSKAEAIEKKTPQVSPIACSPSLCCGVVETTPGSPVAFTVALSPLHVSWSCLHRPRPVGVVDPYRAGAAVHSSRLLG